MSGIIKVKVPDLGDFDAVEVTEVLIQAGDTITQEQALITLETDKATIEIPSTHAGTIKEVFVNVGDNIAQGANILSLSVNAELETKTAIKIPPDVKQQQAGVSPASAKNSMKQNKLLKQLKLFTANKLVTMFDWAKECSEENSTKENERLMDKWDSNSPNYSVRQMDNDAVANRLGIKPMELEAWLMFIDSTIDETGHFFEGDNQEMSSRVKEGLITLLEEGTELEGQELIGEAFARSAKKDQED